METIISYGIIYLLIFRLAVLLLGGLCIFWGYRLFLAPLGQEGSRTGSPDQGGELQISRGSSSVLLKSTAPGIFFAAFGAIIVIAVLAGSQPDVKYKEKQQGRPQTVDRGAGTTQDVTTERGVYLRDPPRSAVPQDDGAVSYYRIRKALTQAVEDGRTAVSLAQDNPDYHDQLARLLFAEGQPSNAVAEQRLAVDKVDAERKAAFQARLNLYEQAARLAQ
ncbi:MAG: hypothetical protein SD837_20575 [Candidatus Electrothrix scaldis]|nr:MAG: hypothetical protein SD837_20575 [Candidatus Electrothrix sp. GW3-3]